ncbi:aldo/keto reductase [Streptomyces sp. NBC_01340]|uniref:aldo/keto reductase n=1 Tax=Streptomyces sp. NBC_01340 TaxID=2903830 RepID=UPI002E0D4DBE|nr:aldo/keto reductase [Streptomyces sp. NBC_01340]
MVVFSLLPGLPRQYPGPPSRAATGTRDDPARPVAELADTLVRLVEAGHARRIGVSNWAADRLSTLAGRLAELGHTSVASYQFSLTKPDTARLNHPYADGRLLAAVRQHALSLLSWSSQARGFFTRTPGVRSDGRQDPFDTEPNRARRERCLWGAEVQGAPAGTPLHCSGAMGSRAVA